MEVQHINIKFFVNNPEAVELEPFLTIFNRWIQEAVGEELLIDVADYRHVYAGPGVVLIGHEANYSMDNTDNRLGLLYNRKALMNSDAQNRLQNAARAALIACQRIEAEPELNIKFNGGEVQLLINDRVLAPNTIETFRALEPELTRLFDQLYGGAKYNLEYASLDPRERFTANVRTEADFDIATLLRNLN